MIVDRDRLHRHLPAQQSVVQLQPFELADAPFGAQIDPFRLQQLLEQIGEHVAALGQAQTGELHDRASDRTDR